MGGGSRGRRSILSVSTARSRGGLAGGRPLAPVAASLSEASSPAAAAPAAAAAASSSSSSSSAAAAVFPIGDMPRFARLPPIDCAAFDSATTPTAPSVPGGTLLVRLGGGASLVSRLTSLTAALAANGAADVRTADLVTDSAASAVLDGARLDDASVVVVAGAGALSANSSADAATSPPSTDACTELGGRLRSWLARKPGLRVVLMDGRSSALWSDDGSLSATGAREWNSEWGFAATAPYGGLIVLSGPEPAERNCGAAVLAAAGFGPVAGAAQGSVDGLPGDARSPVWLCPVPALHRAQVYWNTSGFPARYALGGADGGGVVPTGLQTNGVFLTGIAWYGDDRASPAVSATTLPGSPTPQQLLEARIVAPLNGTAGLKSCSPVSLVGELTL